MTGAALDRLRRGIENLILALLYASFFLAHWQQGALTPIVLQEGLLAVMFLARRPSHDTSTIPEDWVAAIVGTFAPLLIRPGGAPFAAGVYLQLVGFLVAIFALLSLNRSFGLVAANRGVKTGGAYAIIRHPMYAGHFMCLGGYLLTYPNLLNALILGVAALALFARIEAEERLLREDEAYEDYAQDVKWRLVPGVY